MVVRLIERLVQLLLQIFTWIDKWFNWLRSSSLSPTACPVLGYVRLSGEQVLTTISRIVPSISNALEELGKRGWMRVPTSDGSWRWTQTPFEPLGPEEGIAISDLALAELGTGIATGIALVALVATVASIVVPPILAINEALKNEGANAAYISEVQRQTIETATDKWKALNDLNTVPATSAGVGTTDDQTIDDLKTLIDGGKERTANERPQQPSRAASLPSKGVEIGAEDGSVIYLRADSPTIMVRNVYVGRTPPDNEPGPDGYWISGKGWAPLGVGSRVLKEVYKSDGTYVEDPSSRQLTRSSWDLELGDYEVHVCDERTQIAIFHANVAPPGCQARNSRAENGGSVFKITLERPSHTVAVITFVAPLRKV